MTPRFIKAINWVLPHEGGYNEIKGDNGGATNYGISLVFLQSIHDDINHDGIIDKNDIKALSLEYTKQIYYDNFWKPIYEKLPELTSIKLFDSSINMGTRQAHILLQKALNLLGSNLQLDGLIGNDTLVALSGKSDIEVLNSFCNEQVKFYNNLIIKNPSYSKFQKGWLNRANDKPI